MRAISENKILLKVSIIVDVFFLVVGVGFWLFGSVLMEQHIALGRPPPPAGYNESLIGGGVMFLAFIGGLVIVISYLVMQGLGRPIGIVFMVIGGLLLLLCFLQGKYVINILPVLIVPILLLLVIGLILVIVNPQKKELKSKNHRDGNK